MKIEYYLKTKAGKVLPIIISEESKKDFMDMMNWSENKFKRMTVRKFLKGEQDE